MKLRSRLRNAWAAFLGRQKTSQIAGVGIELDLDTAPFERGVERAKELLVELHAQQAAAAPPMIVQFPKRLSLEAVEVVRQHVKAWRDDPAKVLIIDPSAAFYQLVGGQWVQIAPHSNDADG